jgi:hypothetical protein
MGKYTHIFSTTLSNEFLIKSSTIENLRIPLGKDNIKNLNFLVFLISYFFIYLLKHTAKGNLI